MCFSRTRIVEDALANRRQLVNEHYFKTHTQAFLGPLLLRIKPHIQIRTHKFTILLYSKYSRALCIHTSI